MNGERPQDHDEEELKRAERIQRGRQPSGKQRRQSQSSEAEQPEQADQSQEVTKTKQGQQAQQADVADEGDHETETEQAAQAEGAQKEARAQQVKLEPVTQREHDTFYLDSDVRAELERIYRRVSLDILEETSVDIDDQRVGGRNRYFRPLALLVGARELAEKTPDELREMIEDEELVDDLPDVDGS